MDLQNSRFQRVFGPPVVAVAVALIAAVAVDAAERTVLGEFITSDG